MHLRLRFQNRGKPRTAGLCGRGCGRLRLRPFICTKIERLSSLRKPPCKVRFFVKNRSRKYRPKVTVTTLFQTTSHRTFSTSHTNAPRSLSRVKAGTHSAFGERSHTRAHTAKQGHPLPRPQHCLELSAKFFYSATLLYTYISRFTVNPHYISRGRKSGKVAVTVLSQTTSRRAFQLLPQTAHVCFHSRKRVHTRLSEKNRTQGHTRRNRGVSDGGGITTLGAFHTFRKPCVTGV